MKIPEEIIRTRMLKLGKQYIANLYISDIVDMMEEYAGQFKTVLATSVCPDWIHNERVKMNDDKFCPICGKKLQTN